MEGFPHHYIVSAMAGAKGNVSLMSDDVPPLETGPSPQFGGAKGKWSPEGLLMAAVADCFILTFRAIARASRLEWGALECTASGTLERADGVTRFTTIAIDARLAVHDTETAKRAERLLHKAEENCLITNSLNAETKLRTTVDATGTAAALAH
ncbi:MAG: OsmC family peroxiredoxin [Gammaproteobacteria bacterium]|nr:MAG: OsmC family peroxiredoxin [Gammaproteobacteria bacterium]